MDEITTLPDCVCCGKPALILWNRQFYCGLCQINLQKEQEYREKVEIMKVALKEIEEEKLHGN